MSYLALRIEEGDIISGVVERHRKLPHGDRQLLLGRDDAGQREAVAGAIAQRPAGEEVSSVKEME